MQATGFPVEATDIILKSSHISRSVFDRDISTGWYRRFLQRHPNLVARQAQVISRPRDEVNANVVQHLFNTILKLIIEQKIDGPRIFNVDEPAFLSRRKSRRVVALKGPSNQRVEQASNSELSPINCCVCKRNWGCHTSDVQSPGSASETYYPRLLCCTKRYSYMHFVWLYEQQFVCYVAEMVF